MVTLNFKAWEYSVNFWKELEAGEREGEANYFALFYDCGGNASIYLFLSGYLEMIVVLCHQAPS